MTAREVEEEGGENKDENEIRVWDDDKIEEGGNMGTTKRRGFKKKGGREWKWKRQTLKRGESWMREQQRKGRGVRLNESKRNAGARVWGGRAAGQRSTALLTQLESCELVVNGVLIQRWDFQSKHITKLCALLWVQYSHWRVTVRVQDITNATPLLATIHVLSCLEAQIYFLICSCSFEWTLLLLLEWIERQTFGVVMVKIDKQ